jgi:hypothetical protein
VKRAICWAAALAVVASFAGCKKLERLAKPPGERVPAAGGREAAGAVGGDYVGSGTNPDGGSYECEVTVTRSGKAFRVMCYFDGKPGYEGTGILKGETFVVGYAGPQGYGIVAYEVKADGSLDGTWAGKGSSKLGTEKLTRK